MEGVVLAGTARRDGHAAELDEDAGLGLFDERDSVLEIARAIAVWVIE